MENAVKTDVLIVGAGPTGLSLALQLMRYGIDFVIIDKKEGVTDLSKALIVHARTLEIYDQIGLARKAVEAGEKVQKGALMHSGKISAHLDFSDFGSQLSSFPFLLIYEQSKNEHLLYGELRRNGNDVQWQTGLQSLKQDAAGVYTVLKDTDGQTHSVEARYVVGCDGSGSETRHLLGLGFEGSTHPRLFYVADVEMEFQAEKGTFYAPMEENSFVLIVPMQGGKHWRLIGNLPEHENSDHDVSVEEAEAKVKQLVQQPLDITKVRWFSTYRVHTRRAERFSLGRCFLAGDAAHVHTPAGGQGMNTGIQDAYNLAWKIALVLRGEASHSLLDSYNEERVANAKRLLQSTDQFFDIAASDKWYLRLFRNSIFPTVASIATRFDVAKEILFPTVSQIGINYRESALSLHNSDADFDVKAGDRMPYFKIDGASIYDRLNDPKFHLLVFSDGEQSYGDRQASLVAKYGDLLDVNVVPLYPRVIELFGTNRPFTVLLRPDNYIGYIYPGYSSEDVESYLDKVIGHSSTQLSYE
ncbi:FAD-dependent monooxygenase [Spirosoma soli]|uniref:FAD-dependent monooxygenase n=1 Tax=Spirosoma soli TaxID=1770529 RepID=A0ABW5MCZ8_9BACT